MFFKIDLDGYEMERAFEFPKPVCPKPTTWLLYKALSYSYGKIMLDKSSRKP